VPLRRASGAPLPLRRSAKQTPGGDVFIDFTVTELKTPTLGEMALMLAAPVIKPLQQLPVKAEALRRDMTHCVFSVNVREAKGLAVSSASGAKSQASVAVAVGELEQMTRKLARSSDPAWGQKLHFTGTLEELLAAPIQLLLMIDKAKRGSAEIELSPLVAPGGERSSDFALDVSYTCPIARKPLKATLNVTVAVESLTPPTWQETLFHFCEPVLAPLIWLKNLPAHLKELQRDLTVVTFKVLLKSAHGLKAADGRGKSDPYATFTLGTTFQYSTVVPKTVDPVWDETFVYQQTVRDIRENPLMIELFDEDVLNKDDALGAAELDLALLIDDPVASTSGVDYELLLAGPSTGITGSVSLSVFVENKVQPTQKKLLLDIMDGWYEVLRSFVVYHRMPYDRTIWAKLRDWQTLLVMLIAASPDVFVRGGFFTFFLVSIVKDREEFQLMRFILGLKGTQFISGLLKAILAYFGFWQCTVTSPDPAACRNDGPGVGSSVRFTAALLVWLQMLMWTAFLLLPYSSQYDPQTGRLSYERANALWAANYARAKAQQREKRASREVHSASRPSSRVAPSVLSIESTDSLSTTPRPSRMLKPQSSMSKMGGYARLNDEADLESGRKPKGSFTKSAARFITGEGMHFHERVEEAQAVWAALLHPLLNAPPKNRMIMLLKWDMLMFLCHVALLYVMMFFALLADEEARASNAGEGLQILSRVVWPLINGAFFDTWQCQITFSVVKIFFSVSSFPFFTFTIGGLNKLFTHTEPTGYTRDGLIVPADPNGLSAYLDWLKGVLSNEKFAEELSQNFSTKDNERLRKAVASGEKCLITAWKRPSSALRVTRKKKAEIDEVLKKVITRNNASDALYSECFPDQVLVERYLAVKQAAKEAAKKQAETPETSQR